MGFPWMMQYTQISFYEMLYNIFMIMEDGFPSFNESVSADAIVFKNL